MDRRLARRNLRTAMITSIIGLLMFALTFVAAARLPVMSELEHRPIPPAGEEIHMPAPSLIPVINAAALAIAIVSITLNWYMVALGGFVFAGHDGQVDRGRPAGHRRASAGASSLGEPGLAQPAAAE